MTLRTLCAATAVAALCFAAGSPAAAFQPAAAVAPPAPAAIALKLPAPTGAHTVGVTQLHLTDARRADPWNPAKRRELMVSVWYPARTAGGAARAPYMAPAAARLVAQGLLKPIGLDPRRVDLAALPTHAQADAPPARARGGFPVILYSPGGNLPRAMGTTLVEDLASRGYVVVAIDHTHEAPAVEFPGGRLETNAVPRGEGVLQRMVTARVGDMRFVLDRLALMAAGRPHSASRTPLPAGLAQALDLSRIGAFGHSAGGFTALQAAADDGRIDAAANLDGSLAFSMSKGAYGPVVETGLAKPFLLMGGGLSGRERKPHTHEWAPDWKRLWERSSGWKRDFHMSDAEHMSFTDQQVLMPQVGLAAKIPPLLLASVIGKLEPSRSVAAQRAYLAAFFDQHLKGVPQPLLNGRSGPDAAVVAVP